MLVRTQPSCMFQSHVFDICAYWTSSTLSADCQRCALAAMQPGYRCMSYRCSVSSAHTGLPDHESMNIVLSAEPSGLLSIAEQNTAKLEPHKVCITCLAAAAVTWMSSCLYAQPHYPPESVRIWGWLGPSRGWPRSSWGWLGACGGWPGSSWGWGPKS